ncbi:MAG TPA: type I-E CRISPR-associated protein Cse2/CasB [Anaerolineaceae bacterium]|nr:type I-E CRISPR-associated protein Cse2/CasB [Anaerolineaceae bacterium]
MSDTQNFSNTGLFISRLEKLNAGDRARLKRNAGKTLAETHDAIGLFYNLLPHGVPQYQEEIFFLVATLTPFAEGGAKKDFGNSLYLARSVKNNKGLDRRVENLLDADLVQLHFRLRQTVKFLQSCRVRVNWQQLLDDLLHWDHPERYIQQRWARSYFGQENLR